MTNPLDEQQAAHVRCLQDFAAAYDAESDNGRAFRAAIAALTAPPLCAKGEARLGRHMTGRMIEGNFEADTITFQMDRGYYMAAGAYVIEPRDDWEARTTPAQPADGVEALHVRHTGGGMIALYRGDTFVRDIGVAAHWDFRDRDEFIARYNAYSTLAASKADSAQGDWVPVPRELLEDLADDLESQVMTKGDLPRRIKRDLAPVRRARELLEAAPAPQPESGRGEAVTDADVEAVEQAIGMSRRAWDMVDPKEIIAAARRTATPTDAARVRDAERYRRLRGLLIAGDWAALQALGDPENTDELDAAIDAALAAVEGEG